MKNLLKNIAIIGCLISCNIALANNDLCIALTNVSDNALEFSGLVDPGYTYTVRPGRSETLSGDHMVGSCISPDGNCGVSVMALDGTYKNYEIIHHLPRGTRIIYHGLHNYEIDRRANVACPR